MADAELARELLAIFYDEAMGWDTTADYVRKGRSDPGDLRAIDRIHVRLTTPSTGVHRPTLEMAAKVAEDWAGESGDPVERGAVMDAASAIRALGDGGAG